MNMRTQQPFLCLISEQSMFKIYICISILPSQLVPQQLYLVHMEWVLR